MKYNILFISHERKMGGANFALLELIKNLKNAGNNISVVVLYSGCPIDVELKKMGITTFPCLFGWWQQPEYWSKALKIVFQFMHWLQWISVFRISRFVKKNRIQIIHSNSSVIDIGAQVAHKTGCKHVWHFREFGKADYRLEYMYSEGRLIHYIGQHSDMVVFISKALQNYYADIAKKCRNIMVYDGIIPKESKCLPFYDDVKISSKHVFEFLVAGNITPGKNQKLVLEALLVLINELHVSEEKFCVHFAGAETSLQESKRYGALMREYINSNNISNVIFHGFVEDMSQLREHIDAEIVPSMSEAYGRVTLEAMMGGNLVIASDSGSNLELVGDNNNGLLFEQNDAKSLAIQMKYAMEHSCEEYRRRAYQYVHEFHTQEESCQRIQNVYDEIMSGDKKSEESIADFDNI